MPPCRTCGKDIIFVRTETGLVPLDITPPVYTFNPTPEGFKDDYIGERIRNAGVSHFVTCKNPGPFSGQTKKREIKNTTPA